MKAKSDVSAVICLVWEFNTKTELILKFFIKRDNLFHLINNL
jgi:hypothetical protein